MTQSAVKLVDVEKAVRILRTTCQSHSATGGATSSLSSSDDVASLLPSAAFLASHCTPTLLSSLLDACDAATPVAGVPKKLTMLNAAWKLLLAVASYHDVTPSDYEAALVHMIEQLRWGVLTHDWSDKKRVRLATFFASHLVLAVRAHPQLLLTATEAAHTFLAQLVRLYFAVCVTVATSTRDAEAVTTLHDNIVVRLHAIFDCLGSAAASMCGADSSESTTANENDDASKTDTKVDTARVGPAPLEELLSQCVSVAAAADVQEAAGGGKRVQQATATAGFAAFLFAMQGIVKKLPCNKSHDGDGDAENAGGGSQGTDPAGSEVAASASSDAAPCSEKNALASVPTLNFLTESLLLWADCSSTHRRAQDDDEEAAGGETAISDGAAAEIKRDIQHLSSCLPTSLFTAFAPMSGLDAQLDLSLFSGQKPASLFLRRMWTSALATLWQQWIALCNDAEGTESSDQTEQKCGAESQCVSEAATKQMSAVIGGKKPSVPVAAVDACTQLSSLVLFSLTCTGPNGTSASMVAMEAWVTLFHRCEGATVTTMSERKSKGTQLADARVLLRVLTNLRYAAAELVHRFLSLLSLRNQCGVANPVAGEVDDREGWGSTVALLMQWVCATVAVVCYGEFALGIDTTDMPTGAEEEAGDSAGAWTSQLMRIMRAQMLSLTIARSSSSTQQGRINSSLISGVAAAELRDALLTLQQESRKPRKQDEPLASRLYSLCRLLLPIPLKVHQVVVAFRDQTAPSASVTASESAGESSDASLEPLKQCLLSSSSLFAALTQTLQGLAEPPAEPEEGEREERGTGVNEAVMAQICGARVARWVAARLLHEVAATPLTEGADDAVLLACVRRWTDVAFSPASSPSRWMARPGSADREGVQLTAAFQCGDAVVQADAAASLLRIAEECTTLDLGQLNLSEHATAALMGLIEGSSQEVDDVGATAQWAALQAEMERQSEVVETWARRQHGAAPVGAVETGICSQSNKRFVGEEAAELVTAASETSALNAADFLRGLQGCEAVLRQLRDVVSAARYEVEGCGAAKKRQRVEPHGDSDAQQAALMVSKDENACVVRALERICELSQLTLAQLETNSDATASALLSAHSASSPISRSNTVKEELERGRSDEALTRDTQFFTLSDAESVGQSRRASFAEVIDVE